MMQVDDLIMAFCLTRRPPVFADSSSFLLQCRVCISETSWQENDDCKAIEKIIDGKLAPFLVRLYEWRQNRYRRHKIPTCNWYRIAFMETSFRCFFNPKFNMVMIVFNVVMKSTSRTHELIHLEINVSKQTLCIQLRNLKWASLQGTANVQLNVCSFLHICGVLFI